MVAAVGNGEGAPKLPWRYASYPAALPHVIGVGAAAQDGSVPDFSNGDPIYDDVTAPGAAILSTVPRDLSTDRPDVVQGYSVCGPGRLPPRRRHLVRRRAGVGRRRPAARAEPDLTPDQVAT